MSQPLIMTQIEEQIKNLDFQQFGFSPVAPAFSIDVYRAWIEDGLHGEMNYLKQHLPQKEHPQLISPKIQSAIVVSKNYQPSIPGYQTFPFPHSRVARYAKGQDYHEWFKGQLIDLSNCLQNIFPEDFFFPSTDSGPVLERDLASRAGLGWIGKNTCLIDRQQGSLFFIGEILTSLSLNAHSQVPTDHCGTCTRCMDACPTQALVAPRRLDARRCISYWTIESRSSPPPELRAKMEDWLFGCDTCQTVCPWNQKVFGVEINHTPPVKFEDLQRELSYILTTSNRQLMKDLKGTPLCRAGGFGLKRNAIIVATNKQIKTLATQIERYLPHPKLGELAHWSLRQLCEK